MPQKRTPNQVKQARRTFARLANEYRIILHISTICLHNAIGWSAPGCHMPDLAAAAHLSVVNLSESSWEHAENARA